MLIPTLWLFKSKRELTVDAITRIAAAAPNTLSFIQVDSKPQTLNPKP